MDKRGSYKVDEKGDVNWIKRVNVR